MIRCLIPLFLMTAPAVASPFIDYPEEDIPEGRIEIVVPPADLARCRATLAMVLTPVMVDENGMPMLALPASGGDHPDVACVAAQS